MPLDYLVSALVTLLVVVDPVGLAPTFLAVTHGLPAKARKQIAWRACVIAGAILIGTALVGDWLLRQLGIGVPAFRIAGGLLLFAVASEMVLGVRIDRQSKQAEEALEEHVRNIAAFPLAIPLMAGPGAITATLLLASQAGGRPLYLGDPVRRDRRRDAGLPRGLPVGEPHRAAARRHRQCRAAAAARRDPGGAGGAVRDRRRAGGAGGVTGWKAKEPRGDARGSKRSTKFLKPYEPCGRGCGRLRRRFVSGRSRAAVGRGRGRNRRRSRVHRIRRVGVGRVVPVVTIVPPVRPVVAVVVVMMAVVTVVVVVMAMMTMMAVVTVVVMVMAMMTMMAVATAVHHVPTAAAAAAVAATMAAAVTSFSIGREEERRHADNNCCGKGDNCSALKHSSGSLGLLGRG